MLEELSMPNTLSLPSRSSQKIDSSAADGTKSVMTGCVNSDDILRGQKAVEINHNGSTYRLQATRLGKLILTK
jgi:hemin uptake protein HemP